MVRLSISSALLTVTIMPLVAQDHFEIPRVVRIRREEIRQGRRAEHERLESVLIRSYSRINFPIEYLALSSQAGADEFWKIELYPSFARMSELDDTFARTPVLRGEVE